MSPAIQSGAPFPPAIRAAAVRLDFARRPSLSAPVCAAGGPLPADDPGSRSLSAISEDAEQHANAKGEADGLVGVLADNSVGGPGARHRSLFEFAASIFGHFQGGGQTLARRRSSLAQIMRARSQQFFAIAHECF